MTIGRLAREADVNVETVRYYENRGLLIRPAKPARGYRRYSESHLERLKFIRRAKDIGFSLQEIEELASLEQEPDSCRKACEMAHRHLHSVQLKIEKLKAQVRESPTLSRLMAGPNWLLSHIKAPRGQQDPDLPGRWTPPS